MNMTIDEMKRLRELNMRGARANDTVTDTVRFFEITAKCKSYIKDVVVNVIKVDGYHSYANGDPVYEQSFGVSLSEWLGGDEQREAIKKLFSTDSIKSTVQDMTKEIIYPLIGDLSSDTTVEISTYWDKLVITINIKWI